MGFEQSATHILPCRGWGIDTCLAQILENIGCVFPSCVWEHIPEWLCCVDPCNLEWSKLSQGMCGSLKETFLNPAIGLCQMDIQEKISLRSPPRSSPLLRSIDKASLVQQLESLQLCFKRIYEFPSQFKCIQQDWGIPLDLC